VWPDRAQAQLVVLAPQLVVLQPVWLVRGLVGSQWLLQ
jgi:hypothetical protein